MSFALVGLGAIAVAPALFLLVFFYLKDRYEPEPRGHVAFAFVKGAVMTLPIYYAARALEHAVGGEWLALGGWPARLFEAGVLAAGIEELGRWLVFFAFIYRWTELDEPLDGVVYGVALALGFAAVENALFVVRVGSGGGAFGDGVALGLQRALFAVPAHALFGATMGSYFGRAKLGRGRRQVGPITRWGRRRDLFLALGVPILVHTAYDLLLLVVHSRIVFALVAAASVGLWAFVLRRVHTAHHDSPFADRRE